MKRSLFRFLPLLLPLFAGCIRVVSISQEELAFQETKAYEQIIEIEETTPTVKPNDNGKRPLYQPGELVDYKVMSGDTIAALAKRFNTTEEQIRAVNPNIPKHTTTLPPGMPMKIPIYYRSGWGSSFLMLPDALFVNSPAQRGFNARSFTDRQPGWFKYYNAYSDNKNLRGGELVENVCNNYSLSPRLFLALLEYMTGALTNPNYPNDIDTRNVLGFSGVKYKTLSSQLIRLADHLNDYYYRYRDGEILEYELSDGSLIRLDPWLNAPTAALQLYFAEKLTANEYYRAIGPDGFVKTYKQLFGDFPAVEEYPANLPVSLEQPELSLPFSDEEYWTLTGGPHTGYGSLKPYAAVDFAPPSNEHGCFKSNSWVTAPHGGTIVRTGIGMMILDLDDENGQNDADERTGWSMLFMHLKTESIPPVGTHVNKGDPLGHPSCDGGTSSGTHVHIARKYNGEWIRAGGEVALNMDDWVASDGKEAYEGRMTRFSSVAIASQASEYFSVIHGGPPLYPTSIPEKKSK